MNTATALDIKMSQGWQVRHATLHHLDRNHLCYKLCAVKAWNKDKTQINNLETDWKDIGWASELREG